MLLIKNDPVAADATSAAAQIMYRQGPKASFGNQTDIRLAIWVKMAQSGRLILSTRINRYTKQGQPLKPSATTSRFVDGKNDADQIVAYLKNNDIKAQTLKADTYPDARFTRAEQAILLRPVGSWDQNERMIAFRALRQNRYS